MKKTKERKLRLARPLLVAVIALCGGIVSYAQYPTPAKTTSPASDIKASAKSYAMVNGEMVEVVPARVKATVEKTYTYINGAMVEDVQPGENRETVIPGINEVNASLPAKTEEVKTVETPKFVGPQSTDEPVAGKAGVEKSAGSTFVGPQSTDAAPGDARAGAGEQKREIPVGAQSTDEQPVGRDRVKKPDTKYVGPQSTDAAPGDKTSGAGEQKREIPVGAQSTDEVQKAETKKPAPGTSIGAQSTDEVQKATPKKP